MNDDLDERRLRRAVRGALGDILASAPSPSQPQRRAGARAAAANRRRPVLTLAAGLTAAAGLVGIVVIASRDDDRDETASSEPSIVATTAATAPSSEPAAATTEPPTTTGVSTTAPAVPPSVPAAGVCGDATVPPGASDVQTVEGDIDGDEVADTVTLYSIDGEWRVHVTSSVKSKTSDAAISLTVAETATVELADIEDPVAIMVTTEGANDQGILSNFTFLTLNPDYCVKQWIYRNARDVDEPFQWVWLEEPGHVTGLKVCDDDDAVSEYRLLDIEQNDDGSWNVITRVLTHNFTRAEIAFLPERTVADSADFVSDYPDIVGCD